MCFCITLCVHVLAPYPISTLLYIPPAISPFSLLAVSTCTLFFPLLSLLNGANHSTCTFCPVLRDGVTYALSGGTENVPRHSWLQQRVVWDVISFDMGVYFWFVTVMQRGRERNSIHRKISRIQTQDLNTSQMLLPLSYRTTMWGAAHKLHIAWSP